MIQTSDAYKEMMKKPIRNRGYISVSLGVVNQNAQGNAKLDENTTKEYYSAGNLFDDEGNSTTYGTLEQNFTKADGAFTFPPRNTPNADLRDNGLVVPYGGALIIKFDTAYSIKGLTIDFVKTSYPTDFTIVTDEENISITDNDTHTFSTEEILGSTTKITITPTTMSGGVQCMHIKRVVMGVGITFQNSTVESAELESFISGVSIETSYKELNVSAFDNDAKFDVDNESAFINYLQTGQPLNISFGVDLDDGTQEWFQVASCRLKDWSAKRGRVSLRATDLLTQSDETYSHMVIESRTAKSEFEAIFASMGLTLDDYVIDDYFASVYITNPIEENTYRDCLQLIANATRGIVYEDENGIVHVERNFDRQFQATSVFVSPSKATEKTDAKGWKYCESNATTLYDGTFRQISDKNLFNPDVDINTVTIKSVSQVSGYPLLPVEVVDNFVTQGENAMQGQRAKVMLTIRCPQGTGFFPIKESGWYCASYDSYRSDFINPNSAYAKIGDTLLQIETSDKVFNFYVSPQDINKGDLELSFGFEKIYRSSSPDVGIAIRKGKMVNGRTESDESVYTKYFIDNFPRITYMWQLYWASASKHLLFRFDETSPTQIRIGNDYYDITEKYFEYDVPENVDNLVIYMIKGKPLKKSALYTPIAMSDNGYVLPYFNMMEHPYATMDEKIKAIRVKISTYEVEDEEIRRVDDEVYYTETLDSTGVVKTVENPLISSSAQAELVAKWMKAYYVRNITYDVEYRGEPALQANDMIYMENDYTVINPVDAEKVKLNFNGAFSGTIEARKALIVEN